MAEGRERNDVLGLHVRRGRLVTMTTDEHLPELPGFTRLPLPADMRGRSVKFARRVRCEQCGDVMHPNGTGQHRGSPRCARQRLERLRDDGTLREPT